MLRTSRARASAIAMMCAVVLLVAGCAGGSDAVEQGDTFQFVSPGGKTVIEYPVAERKHVVGFSGTDVITGAPVSLQQFVGQVVLINMWASWCGPCRTEVEGLERAYEKYKSRGFAVLGIAIRDPNEQGVRDFIGNHQLTYPTIYDPSLRSLVRTGWPVQVVPTTLIVDREHRAAVAYIRAVGDDEIDAKIAQLVAEPSPVHATAPAAPSSPQP